jgi:hypothetical protein
MNPRIGTCLLIVSAVLGGCDSRRAAVEEQAATVSRYCVDCHNDLEQTAGLSLESRDLAHVSTDPATWEAVIRKLRAGMMPPPGGPAPSAGQRDGLASFLEQALDRAAAAAPNAGRSVPFHRLRYPEAAASLRRLMAEQGLPVPPPPD